MAIKLPPTRQQLFSFLLVLVTATLTSALHAHGPVARVSEAAEFGARLFAADAATGEVVTIDFPAGKLVNRLSTPPFIMNIGLGRNQRYLFAMRGKDTDRDLITIIDTGIDSSKPEAYPPYISRTISGDSPGGIDNGLMPSVGQRDAIIMGNSAEIIVMNDDNYSGMTAIQSSTYKLASPDHHNYAESSGYLYVSHLRAGMIQILDASTRQDIKRISSCPYAHGAIADEQTGRVLFGCGNSTVIIGSRGEETNRELGRINYPGEIRAAAFLQGRNRILWALTEGTLPSLYRLDLKVEPWAFDVLPVPQAIRQQVTTDGNYLLVYTRSGELQIHDGDSGELLRKLTISLPVEAVLDEHVDKAILPDIITFNGTAFVSLPYEGSIVEVDIELGTIVKVLDVGGEPTRLAVIAGAPPPKILALTNQAAEDRWYGVDQVNAGATTYRLNCSVCHGEQGQGNFGLGNIDSATVTAPPPLNGSGHSAHHSLADMLEVINSGVDPVMPAFGGLLSNQAKREVIAYFQSLWPEDVYDEWVEMYGHNQTGDSMPRRIGQKASGNSHNPSNM